MNRFFAGAILSVATAFIGGSAFAEEHGHMHHDFSKDVDAFHAVLAPVWHARPSLARTQDACDKTGEMARLAKEIRSADASQLNASINALKAKCDGRTSEVDAALYDVHEAFHRLVEMKPASSKH